MVGGYMPTTNLIFLTHYIIIFTIVVNILESVLHVIQTHSEGHVEACWRWIGQPRDLSTGQSRHGDWDNQRGSGRCRKVRVQCDQRRLAWSSLESCSQSDRAWCALYVTRVIIGLFRKCIVCSLFDYLWHVLYVHYCTVCSLLSYISNVLNVHNWVIYQMFGTFIIGLFIECIVCSLLCYLSKFRDKV